MQSANVRLTNIGNDKFDYGKKGIQVYGNERDITSVKTHSGNVTSVIKAFVAPLDDIIKRAKKEYFVEHAREFGNFNVQIPNKLTVKDPNDITRTTIKETNIHDSQKLNFKGPAKLTVYDPNSIARTTLKETIIHDNILGNVRTYKTQTGYRREDDKTKSTVRQTLEVPSSVVNMKHSSITKPTVYDPDTKAPTTIRQTTMMTDVVGNPELEKINAGYLNANVEAKQTVKESYADEEHFGGAQLGSGDAYQNVSYDIEPTMKENHYEYYGGAKDQMKETPMDISMMENATSNGLRESTIVEREPTTTSVKVSQGKDSVNMDIKKIEADNLNSDFTRVYEVISSKENIQNTKIPQHYEYDDRLDPDLLEPYKKNPYTQPLPGS